MSSRSRLSKLPVVAVSGLILWSGRWSGQTLRATQLLSAALADSTFMSDSAALRFSFDRPETPPPWPVVVLVHGSGRTTRDEMKNLITRFTSRGFAIFRYDKRGVGESQGAYSGVGPRNSTTMIPQLARDAAAAFRTACAFPDVDHTRCGFFGASQAGWIIPEALQSVPQAAFAIVFSGPTVSVGREIAFSDVSEKPDSNLDSAYVAMSRYTGIEGYDPMPALGRTRMPILWLVGLSDKAQPSRAVPPMLDSLRASSSTKITLRTYPDYGHGLGPAIWPDIDAFLAPIKAR